MRMRQSETGSWGSGCQRGDGSSGMMRNGLPKKPSCSLNNATIECLIQLLKETTMPRLRQDPHNSTDRVPLAAGTSPERIPDGPDLSFTRHSGLAFGQNDGSAPHIVLAAH